MNKTDLGAAFAKRRFAEIEVDGVKLRIRSLNSREMTSWTSSRLDDSGTFSTERAELARERLIALCVVDGEDKQVYPNAADLGLINEWDEPAIAKVFADCLSHVNTRRDTAAKN